MSARKAIFLPGFEPLMQATRPVFKGKSRISIPFWARIFLMKAVVSNSSKESSGFWCKCSKISVQVIKTPGIGRRSLWRSFMDFILWISTYLQLRNYQMFLCGHLRMCLLQLKGVNLNNKHHPMDLVRLCML